MTASETREANRSFLLVLATIAGAALAIRLAYALALAPPIIGLDDTAILTYGLLRIRQIAEVGLLVLAGVALARLPMRAPR